MWYHFTSSRSSRQNKIKKGSRHHFDIIRWSNYQLSKSPMTRISPLYVSVQILGMTFNWQLSMSSVLLFLMDLVDSYIYIPPLKFLWLFYSTKLLLLISNVIVQYERQHEKEPVLNGFGTKKVAAAIGYDSSYLYQCQAKWEHKFNEQLIKRKCQVLNTY